MDDNKWRKLAIELAWFFRKYGDGQVPNDILSIFKFEAALDGVDFERMFVDVKTM